MTNLERWENFFKRKGWTYKKIKASFGDSLLLKTYNKKQRCHIFVKEDKVSFKFFSARYNAQQKKTRRSSETNFAISMRGGTLNIWHFNQGRGIRNLATHGPGVFLRQIDQLTTKEYPATVFRGKKYDELIHITKTCRAKLHGVIEFYLKLNGKKIDKIDAPHLMDMSYPSMKNFPIKSIFLSHIFRKPNLDFNALCKKIFKHKSKLIVKAITEKINPDQIIYNQRTGLVRVDRGEAVNKVNVGYLLKPFLNRGEMELLMQSDKLINVDVHNDQSRTLRKYRKFFRNFTSKQLVHLFTQKDNYYSGYLEDAADQWNQFPDKIIIPEKVQNWKFVHDEITRQYQRVKQEDYEFNVKPALKKIDGIQVDNEVIVVPKTRHELIDWGTKMNNCIAGYHDRFHAGQTVLLGIKENNEIKYNIEINGGVIRQFMANHNSRAPEPVIQKFTKVFAEHGLVKLPKIYPVADNGVDEIPF